jgi:hypothetical protein
MNAFTSKDMPQRDTRAVAAYNIANLYELLRTRHPRKYRKETTYLLWGAVLASKEYVLSGALLLMDFSDALVIAHSGRTVTPAEMQFDRRSAYRNLPPRVSEQLVTRFIMQMEVLLLIIENPETYHRHIVSQITEAEAMIRDNVQRAQVDTRTAPPDLHSALERFYTGQEAMPQLEVYLTGFDKD